jgi:hypothetical protein
MGMRETETETETGTERGFVGRTKEEETVGMGYGRIVYIRVVGGREARFTSWVELTKLTRKIWMSYLGRRVNRKMLNHTFT